MSGLSKPSQAKDTKFVTVTAAEIAPIDPLLELTQPGGPFPAGHAIITDGMGGYIIESTLRPYLLSFSLTESVPKQGVAWFSHAGVSSEDCGPILPVSANLVAVSLSTDKSALKAASYECEVLERVESSWKLLTTLRLEGSTRKKLVEGISVPLPKGTEIGVRVSQKSGSRKSRFSAGVLLLELEN